MSTDRNTTRIVRSWLEEGVTAIPDRVLDAVLDQVPSTPQRGSWWSRWRFGPALGSARLAAGVAAVVFVAFLGVSLLPALSPNGPAATPSPSPTVAGTPAEPVESPLPPGTHSLEGFPVGASFTVPAGWTWCSTSQYEQGPCPERGNGGFQFIIVDNVVVDPCFEELRDPPVGPSVDDLVTALSGLSRFTATAAVDITVDGYAGKEFTLTAPSVPGCTMRTWATPERINGVGLNESNLLRIVDVAGTRVMMAGAYQRLEADADATVAMTRQVMDSVTFTLPDIPDGAIPAGTYTIEKTLGMTVDVPAGWSGCCTGVITKNDFAGIYTEDLTEAFVYDDACKWASGQSQPRGAEAIAAALSVQGRRSGSTPSSVTVAGLPGVHVRLTVPIDQQVSPTDGQSFVDCDEDQFRSWTTTSDSVRYHQAPGQIDDLYLVDIGDRTVVFDVFSGPGTSASDSADLATMLASIRTH